MRYAIACLTSMLLAQAINAAPLTLSSPDGTVQFRLNVDPQGGLVYSISQNENVRLQNSRLGITIDGVDLGAGAVLGETRRRHAQGSFPWRGNRRAAMFDQEVYEISIRSSGVDWTLEVRVGADGVGYRYQVPGNGSRRINGESSSWRLPAGCTVWFQTNTGDYEGAFQSSPVERVPLQQTVENQPGPVFFGPPMTVVYADGSYALVSEAALFNYSGMTLRPEGDARFTAAFQDDPGGWSNDGAILSPWRVLVLASDLSALVNQNLIPALCEPPDPALFPEGSNTRWIQAGKAPCTWMVFGNDGAQWDRQKWFVDLCAATGCEFLLVDAGWRTERWGWLKDGGDLWGRTAELCRYAAERNVGIILWHAYPEGRDDGPGLTTIEAREELFRHCQQAGVKGVKIDFFNSESKQTILAYEDLLRRAAKYQLTVNFHGANKPTGEARTWPNEINREGIREQEYVLWGSLPLSHYGALPFTRMAVGHADFLPGYIQAKPLRNTTAIFQMASTIVFSAPFLCLPDNPEAYLQSQLLEFVRSVPVVWDETIVLPGSKIGEFVLMARRNRDRWYVAALNCLPEPQTLNLNLAFTEPANKDLTVYSDADTGPGFQIHAHASVPADGRYRVTLRPGGGWLARVATPAPYTGWAQ